MSRCANPGTTERDVPSLSAAAALNIGHSAMLLHGARYTLDAHGRYRSSTTDDGSLVSSSSPSLAASQQMIDDSAASTNVPRATTGP